MGVDASIANDTCMAKLTDNRRDDRRGAPSHDTRPSPEQPFPEEENGCQRMYPEAQPM
jgi:hypothetical protein